MATFTVSVGDLTIIGLQSQSLDKDYPMPTYYQVMFIDGPSGKTQLISAEDEMIQLSLLRDWLLGYEDRDAYNALVKQGVDKEIFLP